MVRVDRRLVIAGLDGATWRVLDPLLASGRLPTLARLIAHGTRANLRSTWPPISSAAWVTMMSGKNPGGHGIYDFRNLDLSHYAGHDETLANAHSYTVPTLVDYLSDAGLNSITYQVPMTYPPRPVHGAMVSGYPTPDHRRAYTYPSALAQKLKPLFSYTPDQIGAAAPERQAAIYHEATFNATENLIRLSQLPWNLFFFVFGATDGAQHRFFKYVTADYPGVTDRDRARYGHLLDEVMVTADAALGRLLSHLPADTDILVISDHGGMARPTRAFNTNAWLASEGWLIPRSDIASPLRAAAQRSVEWAKQRLPVAEWVKRTLPSHAKRAIGTWRSGTGNILWEGTVAYRVKLSHPVEGIHLNVRGRQPLGVVPYRHYERVRAEIIAQLWQRAEVVSVQRREEVYHGPFADRAPDILFRLRSDVDSGAGLAEINTVVPTSWLQTISGYHTLGGILVATGPSFRSGAPTSSSLVDIAPTVLHTLGLAVPSGMDGRVLTEILAQERAVVIRPPLDERCPNAAQLGSADEAGLAAALRSLGYID